MNPARLILALGCTAALGAEPTAVSRLAIPFAPVPAPSQTDPSASTPVAGVVVMPSFDVKDSRIKLDDDEILTDKGILASAKKEYLSPLYQPIFGPLTQLGAYYLNFISILGGWHPNDAEALLFYQQHERLRKIGEWDDVIRLAKFSDPKEALELKGMEFETYRFNQEPNFNPLRGPRRHN